MGLPEELRLQQIENPAQTGAQIYQRIRVKRAGQGDLKVGFQRQQPAVQI
jgi:hypothetical protein